MAKPILYSITAQDAAKDFSVSFSWEGNQSFGNRVIIRNNAANTIVYDRSETTFQLKHTIPANSLANGMLYNIAAATIDIDGNVSEFSNPILFCCYSTPEFGINISQNQIVKNTNYSIQFYYSQSEGEELESYKLVLYDSSQTVLYESGLRYNTDVMKISLSGLNDNTPYYIRGLGTTVNGMRLDTGMIYFTVDYEVPGMYQKVTLENMKHDGCIKIQSNLVSLEFKSDSDPIYIDSSMIDVRENRIYLDDSFHMNGDFTLMLRGKDFKMDTPIIVLTDNESAISVIMKSRVYHENNNFKKTYLELTADCGLYRYVTQSNYIENPNQNDFLSMCISKNGEYYFVHIINETSPPAGYIMLSDFPYQTGDSKNSHYDLTARNVNGFGITNRVYHLPQTKQEAES